MKKKIILGISFIIVIFSIIYFFYSKSEYKKNLLKMEKVELIEKKKIELIEEKIESANIIQDVSYSAKDTKGNEYFLKASEGTIDQNQSNFIFLKSVKGVINLKDYELMSTSIVATKLPTDPDAGSYTNPIMVSCGSTMTAAITANGKAYIWGSGLPQGQIRLPQLIPLKSNISVKQISCGLSHVGFVTHDGQCYTWGNGDNGGPHHGAH